MELPDSLLADSYRLSYALFRVAGNLPDRSFRTHLEDKALDIIISTLDGRRSLLEKNLRTADYLVRFLNDTGALHSNTANILFKEIARLQDRIAGLPDYPAEIPAKELFPAKSLTSEVGATSEVVTSPVIPAEAGIQQSREAWIPDQVRNDKEIGSPNDRQTKILEIIRQSGNCRIKDLQDVLPEVSERTLRYDLQGLINRGAIERMGSGGPATSYRMRV